MAYEVILAYYLHMPLLLAFFSYFLTLFYLTGHNALEEV